MKKFLFAVCLLPFSLTGADWTFDAPANPALSGAARAYVSPGDFSTGWWGESLAGTSTLGFWDLGISGTVTANLGAATNVVITTIEWQDGWVYDEFAAVDLPGFTLVCESVEEIESAARFFGGWYAHEMIFCRPAVAMPQLTLTGAPIGTLLNRLTVQCLGPERIRPAKFAAAQ